MSSINISQVGGVATQMTNSDGVNQANMQEVGLAAAAAGGPVLASGLPSLLSMDKLRTIEGKKLVSVAITSSTAGDTQLNCASGVLKLVTPGGKVQLSGSGTTEDVLVATSYVPSTSATSVPLQSPVVNTGQTTAKFDTFNSAGPGGNAMLPDGLMPVIMVYEDSSQRGSFYNMSSASGDGSSSANFPEVALGVFNGSNVDRVRGNYDNVTLLASAARTSTQTIADQINYNARGVVICVDTTVVPGSAPSNVVTINGKDPVSGKYNTLLTGAAITGVGTAFYTIYPGATPAANLTVSLPLPRTYQVVITAGNANSATYSVGVSYIV